MAKLPADENVPRQVCDALRSAGHDVVDIGTFAPGAADRVVLHIAHDQQRILLSFDSDFGDLIYRAGEASPIAVVLLRLSAADPRALAARVVDVLNAHDDLSGHFVVADDERIRLRPLPG